MGQGSGGETRTAQPRASADPDHPSVRSNFPKVLAPEVWGRFTSQWRDRFRMIQVGVEGQRIDPGLRSEFPPAGEIAGSQDSSFRLIRQGNLLSAWTQARCTSLVRFEFRL